MHCDTNARTPWWRFPDPQRPGASPTPKTPPTRTTTRITGRRVAAATPTSRSFVLAALRALHLDPGAPPPAQPTTTAEAPLRRATKPNTTTPHHSLDKPFHTNARSGPAWVAQSGMYEGAGVVKGAGAGGGVFGLVDGRVEVESRRSGRGSLWVVFSRVRGSHQGSRRSEAEGVGRLGCRGMYSRRCVRMMRSGATAPLGSISSTTRS
jgi:hypothetical protein